jgi:hypothetical protein
MSERIAQALTPPVHQQTTQQAPLPPPPAPTTTVVLQPQQTPRINVITPTLQISTTPAPFATTNNQPQVYPATLYTFYPPEQQYIVIEAPEHAVPYIQSHLQQTMSLTSRPEPQIITPRSPSFATIPTNQTKLIGFPVNTPQPPLVQPAGSNNTSRQLSMPLLIMNGQDQSDKSANAPPPSYREVFSKKWSKTPCVYCFSIYDKKYFYTFTCFLKFNFVKNTFLVK